MINTKKSYSIAYLKNPTCKFFTGYKPCSMSIKYKVACPTEHCFPVGRRLLIIEMGGLGSILRTTIVAKEFKRKYKNSQITFLTHSSGIEVLKFSSYVDRIESDDPKNIIILLSEKFDSIYNFEMNEIARSVTKLLSAKEKYGFSMNHNGLPKLANSISADLFRFQVDDYFRGKNTKPIQQLLLESVGMKWNKQKYDISLKKEDLEYARQFIVKNKLNKKILIGLNIGSRKIHAKKRWPVEYFIQLANKLNKISGIKPIIFCGPEEKEMSEYCMSKLENLDVISTNYNGTLGEYMALISKCDVFVSATTFGLLAAIGLGIKTVTICSPKPYHEIYDYNNGIKITTKNEYDPSYSSKVKNLSIEEEYNIGLQDIPVSYVLSAIKDILANDLSIPVRFVNK